MMKTDTDAASPHDPTVAVAYAERGDAGILGTSRADSAGSGVRGLRVRTKVFFSAALLVLFAVGAAVSVASWRAEVIAERTIRDALGHVPQIFSAFRGNVEGLLREKLRSIAEEPGTKSLFAAADAPTRWEFTRDLAKLHGAHTVFLFDRESAVLARSDKEVGEGVGQPFASVKWVADVLDSMRESSAAIREGDLLSLVASVPVFSGEGSTQLLIGVLAASFPLDATRASEVQALTRGEVGFLRNDGKRGEPPRLAIAATTPGLGGDAFLASLVAAPTLTDSLFRAGEPTAVGPIDLTVAGDRRAVIAYPVRSASNETLGALVVSRSRAEETAAFREIRNTLIAVGLLALLAAIPISFGVGRGIARPIESLVAAAQAIRDGNLSIALPKGGSGEIGALAQAFAQMVEELKEKAALEELVNDLRRQQADVTGMGGTRTLGATRGNAGGTPGGAAIRLEAGEVFGQRYRIHSMLGRGGTSSVYRAFDEEIDDDVALKVLEPEAVAEGTLAGQTLKQEIKLARKITHPNVVRTHDLGSADGIRFITMEYVPGMTLRQLIDRRGALALGPGLQISKQILRGLAAVHEAGILHRDIKPGNVMVLPNGVVKLMDFGISSVAEGTSATDGFIRGTPAYMSPEQACGEALDLRSDIYATGTVMFEIFTGKKAFGGEDTTAAFLQRKTDAPPRPSRLRSDLPENLERIILDCLASRREDRPASVQDVYTALMSVTA